MNEDKIKFIKGVKYVDYSNTYVSPQSTIGKGSIIEPGVIIKGDSKIGNNTIIKAYAYIDNSIIKDDCFIGQNSLIRGETILENNVVIGSRVELKSTHVGENSGIYHSGFIGDAVIGKNCKLGANVITANTTFENVTQTTQIGNNVQIGVGTIMVAPVTIGNNVVVGANSFINKNITSNKKVFTKKILITKEVINE